MTPPDLRREARDLLRSATRGRGSELRRLLGWAVLAALPAFLSGRLIATAIDDGFLAGRSLTGFAWLGIFGASAAVGAWAMRATILHLAQIVEPFRDDLARLVVGGSLRSSTRAGSAGDTAGVARLTQQVEIVRDAYASILLAGQSFLVATGGALLGLLTLMPQLLLMVAPPLVLGLAMFLAALRHMAARQRDCILEEEHVAESGAALATGVRDIVACGAEDAATAMVGAHVEAQARATRDLARLTAVRSVSVAIGGLLPIVLILVSGSWLVGQGATAGTIFGALTYVLQGVHPALQAFVNAISGPGLWLMVTLRRILEASRPPEADREPDEAPVTHPPHHGVRLEGVTFAYGPCSEPIVCDFDLAVAHGEHLVVVGPSGVGKSTLANLICGVLEPQAGEISIGGVALAAIGAEAPAHRALIAQEAYLFSGSVFENIAYLRPDVGQRELDRAVDALGMRALLERLGGYDAEVDPAGLSAGERQLVTLVRAYLSPAWLVVLDEASCHLDPRSEALVESAFARRPGTLIVIAHRVSSALRAQRILVLDGHEPQHGTHAELIAGSSLYRDLIGRWQASGVTSLAAPDHRRTRSAPPPRPQAGSGCAPSHGDADARSGA
ncbi:MAG TPA: ABC transporter ATP-binding protein [Solirubrobacteraceae bacterium]|jgi:ATP-binding cassette subfamily C protein|nr:ABC transporter ATP-binding protein [Solirubrobacteraceae bacterium]